MCKDIVTILLVPINAHAHWTLVVIDLQQRTMKYYDSKSPDPNVIDVEFHEMLKLVKKISICGLFCIQW